MKHDVAEAPHFIDNCPESDSFLGTVLEGLRKRQKSLPPKFFYDARGSRLFEEITELQEYYLTRTEIAIMKQYVREMASYVEPGSLLLEYGSGSSIKTRVLLDQLSFLVGYIPIDISRDHLLQSADRLSTLYPGLNVLPVCADYTTEFSLPSIDRTNTLVYFPGSTVGNFEPGQAKAFLHRIARVVGPGGGLLIGVDLKKDSAVIEAAYNDVQEVTAAFNKNMLLRINGELDGKFDLDLFSHRALYNPDFGRIEMHLVSRTEQVVQIGEIEIHFDENETILTEYSYKYSLDDFAQLAESSFSVEHVWTDEDQLFSVQYLTAHV